MQRAEPLFFIFPPIPWDYPMVQRPQALAHFLSHRDHPCHYIDVQTKRMKRKENLVIHAASGPGRYLKLLNAILTKVKSPGSSFREHYRSLPDPLLLRDLATLARNGASVAIFQSPAFWPYLKPLKEQGVFIVFDLIDCWPAFSFATETYRIGTKILMLEANQVWCSGNTLSQWALKEYGRKPFLVPNGYYPEDFEKSKRVLPREFKNELRTQIAENSIEREDDRPGSFPQKRLVYIGTLGEWFDLELIVGLAKREPAWQILLIGECHDFNLTELPRNVLFLGRRPHRDLQNYLRVSDIGLIPFKKSLLTESVNPIKVYEYLATELPVVATGVPEIANFPGVHYLEDTDRIQQVCTQLKRQSFPSSEVKSFLENRTWEKLFESGLNQILKEMRPTSN